MSNRLSDGRGSFAGGIPGSPQPQPPLSWDAQSPKEGQESWRYVRRNEIAQFAIPFVVNSLREELATPAGESWRPDDSTAEEADRRIVERAVRLAALLQQAVDRARPRT